jgi:hypothetical protein
MTFLHLDLCCGLGGWSQPFRDDEKWRSVGLDIREDLSADVIADVRALPLRDDTNVTLITASPPCVEFTKYRLPWFGNGCYDGPEPSMELVEACLETIERLQPRYWIMENVVGLSKYWRQSRKNIGPWHFWGEFPPFNANVVWKGQRFHDPEERSEKSAEIPSHIAYALKRSVEIYAPSSGLQA